MNNIDNMDKIQSLFLNKEKFKNLILDRSFYERDTAIVAKELLNKILITVMHEKISFYNEFSKTKEAKEKKEAKEQKELKEPKKEKELEALKASIESKELKAKELKELEELEEYKKSKEFKESLEPTEYPKSLEYLKSLESVKSLENQEYNEFKTTICAGKIVEVEAYYGIGDPASHACNGPTPRSKIMFETPGIAYVYFCYGNHYLLNAVTERFGKAGAVLIRAVEPIEGIEIMQKRRKTNDLINLTNGPGKLTKAFGITKDYNGKDLTNIESDIFIINIPKHSDYYYPNLNLNLNLNYNDKDIKVIEDIKNMEDIENIENIKQIQGMHGIKDIQDIKGKENIEDEEDAEVIGSIEDNKSIVATPRIGIKNGADKLLRFYIKNNKFVSRK